MILHDTIPANASPWKRAAVRPLQRKKTLYSANAASTVSRATILNFLESNELRTYTDVQQYQAAATKAFNSTTADARGGDSFFKLPAC